MRHWTSIALGAVFAASIPAAASAQASAPSVALPRRDITFTVGWQNGNGTRFGAQDYDEWYHDAAYGGAIAGWHWTDHVKTELEVGTTSTSDFYTYRQVNVLGTLTYQSSEVTVRTHRLAIGQQYQFYRNAWFHPHVTAGADLLWERTTEEIDAITTFDQATRTTRVLRPASERGPDTAFRVNPYAEVGFKAYMSPRAFFRSDMRFTIRDGVDQVLLRLGFGIDF